MFFLMHPSVDVKHLHGIITLFYYLKVSKPQAGFEPTICGLQNHCLNRLATGAMLLAGIEPASRGWKPRIITIILQQRKRQRHDSDMRPKRQQRFALPD